MPSRVRASSVSSISSPARDAAGELVDLEVDDPGEVLAGEAVEDDDVVDPVQELGLEGGGEDLLDLLAHLLVVASAAMYCEPTFEVMIRTVFVKSPCGPGRR